MSVVDGLADLVVPIDSLTPLPDNPRKGDVEAVAASLARFGQRKPIVVRASDRTITAGNHTWLAAKSLGWSEIAAVVLDDDDTTAGAYALADNRTAELGGYDERALLDLIRQVGEADPALLADTGWDEASVSELVDSLGTENPFGFAGDADEGDATPPEVPVTVLGDLWMVGPHRVLCGSVIDETDLKRVLDGEAPGIVYTDPPYGIDIVKGNKIGSGGPVGGKIGSGKIVPVSTYKPVIGDETSDTARDAFKLISDAYPNAMHVWWGANHYAGAAELPNASCWIVWDKENGGNDFADAELAWTNHPGAVRIFRHMWNGMIRASERGKRVHPNQKPVALAQWALDLIDPDRKRDTVLDGFGGSGSTALGAHVTGRAGRIIELDPAYVDVICRRLQEVTGELPFNERLGEPVDLVGRADATA